MKKLLFLILVLLISLIISLFMISNQKDIIEDYYTIIESKGYVMEEDREISFDIYSRKENTLIENPLNNEYVLELDTMKIKLEDIRIEKNQIKDKLYLIKIYSNMPLFNEEEYHSKTSKLVITNSKYSLNLAYGEMSFLNPKGYKLISLDGLFGSYIEYHNSLILAGINIKFHDEYEYLTSIKAVACHGILSKAREDLVLENQIDNKAMGYNYNPIKPEQDYLLTLNSKTYFIPLGYSEVSIIRSSYLTFTLDTKKYYFDTFDFMTNILDLDNYQEYQRKGEIKYA